MIIQFRTTVKMDDDGQIQSAQVIRVQNLTEEIAELMPDLNQMQNTFRRGVVKIMSEDTGGEESPVDDDDADDLVVDDDEDDDEIDFDDDDDDDDDDD